MRGEISATRVVAIGDVGCESEDDRCAAGSGAGRFRKIERGIQFYFVAHRNFYAPLQRVIGGRRGWARFGDWLGGGQGLRDAGVREDDNAEEGEAATFPK